MSDKRIPFTIAIISLLFNLTVVGLSLYEPLWGNGDNTFQNIRDYLLIPSLILSPIGIIFSKLLTKLKLSDYRDISNGLYINFVIISTQLTITLFIILLTTI